jgi:hypothetical protein
VLLNRNSGRFTAKPIAVREAEPANPVSPSSGISIDGMVSELGSVADVTVAKRCHETRNSFSTRGVKLLVKNTDIACVRDTFWVVRPGGVTCPMPPCSLSLNR